MTIRWGIISCGDVTEVKSGPALQKAEGSALVAVMRRDAAKAADYAKRHHVPRWYVTAEELIADPEVDAVYVATPPSSHLDLARRVAAAGKPCLVEKPMARTAGECRQMADAFAAAKVPLFVAYYRRALPVFVQAKHLVDHGSIGTVTGVSCRFVQPAHRRELGWRGDAETAGGGLFVDLASHALNAIDWIVGPLTTFKGDAARVSGAGAVEELATLTFRCANGALGTAHYNFASDVSEDVIEITGTDGRLTWSCFGRGELTIERSGLREQTMHPAPAHVHQPLVQTIVDELRGKGRCPSDAISGMRTSEMIDAALVHFYGSRDGAWWAARR